MFENLVPIWLPIGNIVSSVVALVAAIILIKQGKVNKLIGFALIGLTVVCVAGALFQANILGLPLWLIFGSGGRIVAAGLLLAVALHKE